MLSSRIFFIHILSIRIVNYVRILPPMNLPTMILLAMIIIGIVGTVEIGYCHLLGFHHLQVLGQHVCR